MNFFQTPHLPLTPHLPSLGNFQFLFNAFTSECNSFSRSIFHDISDSNMRCEICFKELWDDMSIKVELMKELHSLVKALNKSYKVPREEKYGVCKKIHNKIDRLLLHNNRFGYHII